MNNAIYYTELILPERRGKSAKRGIVGYLCRAALAFLCVFGFAVFINDALALEISIATQIITCVMLCLWFAVMGISKRFFTGGTLIGVGIITIAAIRSEHLAEKIYFCVLALTNAFYRRLEALGYKGAEKNLISFKYSQKKLNLTESEFNNYAFIAVMLIMSAVICACILKRIHLFPLIAVGGSICTLFLYYGMNSSNTGFAIIIASLCGCVSLMGYDRIYARKKVIAGMKYSSSGKKSFRNRIKPPRSEIKSDRTEINTAFRLNSALGGFTGLASALLALVLLLIPAGIKNSMKDIPAISVPAMKLENFLISVANGQNPDFSSLVFSGVASLDKRATATENRSYTGARMFEVRVDTAIPVYLRSWVGTDYYNDSWHSADYDRIGEYKRLLGEGFSPELLSSELLNAVNPSLIGLKDGSSFIDRSELGYVTAAVNIKKLQPTANLVFLPSYTDQTLGLLDYGSRDKSNVGYTSYFDGIYTSTSYLFLDEYAVVANLPLLRDPDFASNLSHLANEYVKESRTVSAIRTLIENNASPSTIDAVFKQRLNAGSSDTRTLVPYFLPKGENTLSYRYTYKMEPEERQRIDLLIDSTDKYNNYVYENYLSGCEEFDRFQKLARDIIYNGMPDYVSGSYAARHKIVMAIIDYLSENMTYTLTPEEPSETREYINAAETFLFDTNEGYCVQFATSAVMLLRSLGIPARYAEGYITGTFNRIANKSPTGRYSSIITDNNAHAWVEVYYDYYGWVQYEATSPYYSDMYEPPVSTVSGSVRNDDYGQEIPDDISGEIPDVTLPTEPKNKTDGNKVLFISITAIIFLLTGSAVYLYIRAERANVIREKLITSAKSGSLEMDKRLCAASKLDAGILRLLAYNKLVPIDGEQQREFAVRVDDKLGPISSRDFFRVSEAMLSGEFGRDISRAKLAEIAAYYDDLIRCSLRGSNPFKRLWLKYIYLD